MRYPLISFVALFAAGCARVSTTTTLHADGSFERKVVYKVSKGNAMMAGMQGGGGQAKQTPDKPEDFFKLPTTGPGVSVVRGDTEQYATVTVSRELGAGASVQDIALWAAPGKVQATSTVSVSKLSDGNVEYIETLHSLNPSPQAKDFQIAGIRAQVKKAIPAEFQQTETIDRVTKAVIFNIAQAMMGPPEPSLADVLLNPEGAIRHINSVALPRNAKAFKDAVPSMTDIQALDAAKSLSSLLTEDTMNQKTSDATSPGKEDSGPNATTSLFFSVKYSGSVVETNGILDPVNGDVYWSLLPEVLDLGDVQLRLVVKP